MEILVCKDHNKKWKYLNSGKYLNANSQMMVKNLQVKVKNT